MRPQKKQMGFQTTIDPIADEELHLLLLSDEFAAENWNEALQLPRLLCLWQSISMLRLRIAKSLATTQLIIFIKSNENGKKVTVRNGIDELFCCNFY